MGVCSYLCYYNIFALEICVRRSFTTFPRNVVVVPCLALLNLASTIIYTLGQNKATNDRVIPYDSTISQITPKQPIIHKAS